MKHVIMSLGWASVCVLAAGCGGEGDPGELGGGVLRATLSSTSVHDVAAVRYRVVAETDTCSGEVLAESTVGLDGENLQPGVLSGGEHRFAAALFTLPAESYRVCAQPLTSAGEASVECSSAEGTTFVSSGFTSEVVLISQCAGDPTGAINAVTVLNDPPRFDGMTADPSTFIDVCRSVLLTADVNDPNGDALTYDWSVASGAGTLNASDNTARFSSTIAGTHRIHVTVSDAYGGEASFEVPIHVSSAECDTTFRGIGTLSPSSPSSEPFGISGDGGTVVGTANNAGHTEAMRWQASSGIAGLGLLPGGQFTIARGVSHDGGVIVGHAFGGGTAQAFRYDLTGMTDLGTLPGGSASVGIGVSGDGLVAIGYTRIADTFQPFRWTEAGGMVGLGLLGTGTDSTFAFGTNADGSVIVGNGVVDGFDHCFRWTQAEGLVNLGAFPGGSSCFAQAVSADGNVIVGSGLDGASNIVPFRWTEASGFEALPLFGGTISGQARAASADGSVVVGTLEGNTAFVWDAVNGTRALSVVLIEAGIDMTGWNLRAATGVSADGHLITGYGDHGGVGTEGWIARIP